MHDAAILHGLGPYPVYRDSEVAWLGDIPAHWEVKRNKLIYREVADRSSDGSEELLTVSQYTGVTRRRDRISEENGLITNAASLVGYKRVGVGDLAINIMLSWNGSLGVSQLDGIVSPAYCVFRPTTTLEPRYFHFLLRTPLFTGAFKTVSTGVVDSRLRLYPEVFFRLPSLVPPQAEQAAIVRFLDYSDRQIRRYIHAKQRLIALLEEQKQAIIHRGVTRGLDPDVRLKPSGVGWLGEVPEHWDVVSLARVIAEGPRNGVSTAVSERGTVKSFSISAVRDGKVDIRPGDQKYIVGEKAVLEQTYSLTRGDVLLVRGNGNIRLVGKAGVVDEDLPGQVYPDLLMRVRLTSKCLPQYLVALLNGPVGREQLESAARTAVGTFKINNQQVRRLHFALPPAAEQQRILDFISAETGSFMTLMNRAREEIALLREYRSRLITDVVTGKLDVRRAVANLPECEHIEAQALAPDDEPMNGEDAAMAELAEEFEEVEI